jgi:Zn-dependent protease with chaperone function
LKVAGHYFPPGVARFTDATLERSSDGKSICVHGADGNTLDRAPRRSVHVSSRLGSLARRLDFPGGARFETRDNDGVDELLGGGSGLLHRLEQNWRMVLAGVIIAAAAAAWFVFYGVPLAALWMAERTPPTVSAYMTRETLATMDGRLLNPTKLSAAEQHRFSGLFAAVASYEPRGAGGYRLLFRNAPLVGPNAFALPDGAIVLTDQLVPMFKSDDEIEGVFAHEMAHVNRAHVLQRVYQASLVPAAIAFITGDATQVGHFATILPGVLLQSAYSRQFEQQADDDAAALLLRMGKNPGALANLLERMEKSLCGGGGCGSSWLGSHPATAERAARLRHAR